MDRHTHAIALVISHGNHLRDEAMGKPRNPLNHGAIEFDDWAAGIYSRSFFSQTLVRAQPFVFPTVRLRWSSRDGLLSNKIIKVLAYYNSDPRLAVSRVCPGRRFSMLAAPWRAPNRSVTLPSLECAGTRSRVIFQRAKSEESLSLITPWNFASVFTMEVTRWCLMEFTRRNLDPRRNACRSLATNSEAGWWPKGRKPSPKRG